MAASSFTRLQAPFSDSTVNVLSVADTDPDLRGFHGGFSDGAYGYLVPLHSGAEFGKVARFSLSDFGTVQVLNVAATDSDVRRFNGGFLAIVYGYLVPYRFWSSRLKKSRILDWDLFARII